MQISLQVIFEGVDPDTNFLVTPGATIWIYSLYSASQSKSVCNDPCFHPQCVDVCCATFVSVCSRKSSLFEPGVSWVALFFRSSHSYENQFLLGTEHLQKFRAVTFVLWIGTHSQVFLEFSVKFLPQWPLQDTSKTSGNARFCKRFLGECSLSTLKSSKRLNYVVLNSV